MSQTIEQRQALKAEAIAALRRELLAPVPARRDPRLPYGPAGVFPTPLRMAQQAVKDARTSVTT